VAIGKLSSVSGWQDSSHLPGHRATGPPWDHFGRTRLLLGAQRFPSRCARARALSRPSSGGEGWGWENRCSPGAHEQRAFLFAFLNSVFFWALDSQGLWCHCINRGKGGGESSFGVNQAEEGQREDGGGEGDFKRWLHLTCVGAAGGCRHPDKQNGPASPYTVCGGEGGRKGGGRRWERRGFGKLWDA
jgi:hypothetical protein